MTEHPCLNLPPRACQVVVEAEISRDKVPLRNAYKHVGQRASLRVSNGVEHSVLGATQYSGTCRAPAWTASVVRHAAQHAALLSSGRTPGKIAYYACVSSSLCPARCRTKRLLRCEDCMSH